VGKRKIWSLGNHLFLEKIHIFLEKIHLFLNPHPFPI
jgi:hypothetical protein